MKHSYTTTEAADICQVSRGTLLRWIREGRLKASATFGGHHRIETPDLVGVLQKLGMTIPPALSMTDPKPSCILVVDDDEDIRKLVRHYLTKYFPRRMIEEAGDGFSAGIKVQKYLPDLVILDVMLPGIRGDELCRSIREMAQGYKPSILGISAHQQNWEKNMIESGADLFIRKPFSENELIQAIRCFETDQPENRKTA